MAGERLQLQVILDTIDKTSPALRKIIGNAKEFSGKFGEAEEAVKKLQRQQQLFAKARDLQNSFNENSKALAKAKADLGVYVGVLKKGGDAAKAVGKTYREAQERVGAASTVGVEAMSVPTRRPVSQLEAENSRLRRALADAQLDVEILRKATAYFAKGSR